MASPVPPSTSEVASGVPPPPHLEIAWATGSRVAAYMFVTLPPHLRSPTLTINPRASSPCTTSIAWRSEQPARWAVIALLP